jgi:dehydrogenase/reductase SDR family member 7B
MSNLVIWITGASSGIGEAVAKKYSGEGHKVILSARKENELDF